MSSVPTPFLSTTDVDLPANTPYTCEQKRIKKKGLKKSKIVYSYEKQFKKIKKNEWCENVSKQGTYIDDFPENSLEKQNIDSVKSGESVFKVNTHTTPL